MAQSEDDESAVFFTSPKGEEKVASPTLVEKISQRLQGEGLTVVAPHGPYLGWTMRVLADDRSDLCRSNRGLPMVGTESWNRNLAQKGHGPFAECLEEP